MSAFLKIISKPAVKLSVSLLIVLVLLYNLPLADLWNNIQKVPLLAWIGVLAGFLSGHIIGTLKWRLFINLGKKKLPMLEAIRCYFAGLFGNLFLPSLAGGDVIRAGMAIRYNKEKGITIFGSLLDRFIDTCSLAFIILVAAIFAPRFFQSQDQQILYSILIIITVLAGIGGGLFFVPLPEIRFQKLTGIINRIKQVIAHIAKNPAKPLIAFFLSLCIQAGFILLNAYLANICGIHIPLMVWFLVWPLAKLSALLPISMGGIGVREVALAALLSRLLVPIQDSVALGFLWESVLISGGIIGGIIYLILTNLSKLDAPSLVRVAEIEKGS